MLSPGPYRTQHSAEPKTAFFSLFFPFQPPPREASFGAAVHSDGDSGLAYPKSFTGARKTRDCSARGVSKRNVVLRNLKIHPHVHDED